MGWRTFFGKRSRLFWGSTSVILVALLGLLDYRTGFELSLSLFYLIPIFTVAWFTDETLSLGISALSAVTWFLTDYASGLVYSNPMIYVWNTLIRLGFFIITSRLLSELRNALKTNQELARVDYVTGATSTRYFYELVNIEINRSRRTQQPLTLVYFDLDNFKAINDRLGHITGDTVLRTVATKIRSQVRANDVLARMGGDEFALLLPETGTQDAKKVVNRVHECLINEMLSNGWTVTFSVGAVTFKRLPGSVDEMVKLADGLMYQVKTGGKNGVRYHIYKG